MYFSTNSRYVLHRAQWMTPPTFILKGAERLLSVKVPNDDPSKPPLRVNIPKESSHLDKSSKIVHTGSYSAKNFPEPRSRSLVSRPKHSQLNSAIREGILPKSESESHLYQLEAEDTAESDVIKEPSNKLPENKTVQSGSQISVQDSYCAELKSENDYQEGLKTPLHDPATGEALANSYVNNSAFGSDANDVGAVQSAAPAKSQSQVHSDPRMLYIIVDSPEEEKNQGKSVADSSKREEGTSSTMAQDDFATAKAPPHKTPTFKYPQSKWGRAKPESWLSRRSKSLSKMPGIKFDGKNPGRRLDVQEIEDLGTYVQHSKQNLDVRNKAGGVECVPEKEFTTRSESLTYNEVPIKVPAGAASKSFKGLSNEMVAVEELPEFVRFPDSRRKHKSRFSGTWGQREDKLRSAGRSKNTAPFPRQSAVDKNRALVRQAPSYPSHEKNYPNVRDSQKYLQCSVDASTEKGRNFRTFLKDSFGGRKSAAKTVALEMPSQVSEEKQDESISRESAASPETAESQELEGTNPASYSSPAVEEKPEYKLTKVETEPISVQTSRSDYFSPWKDNSSNYPDAPQIPLSNWNPPAPAPRADTPAGKSPERKHKRQSKKPGKYADSKAHPEEVEAQGSNSTKSEKADSEGADFQPSASFVSIGCDKVPTLPMTFSAAFPPLLCEALKIRGRILGFRREFLFNDKWTGKLDYSGKHLDTSSKSTQKNKVDLSENSILFPKTETDKFDCPLFGKKKETSLNIGKEPKGEPSPKISDNFANVANESLTEIKGQASVDSLDMMKKVKKIVDFQLENAIKIFKKEEPPVEASSVVMFDGQKWRVDTDTLERYIKTRKEAAALEDPSPAEKIAYKDNILGDERSTIKIHDLPRHAPMYLPPKPKSDYDIKLSNQADSVIAFNPQTNEFFVNKEALASAIRLRADQFLDDAVIQTLGGWLKKRAENEAVVAFHSKDGCTYEMKSGDSILVFDEETQTWKVDYSILEKREEQLRMEEELTKRSELILETFEKLEKGQITKIPTPDTKDRKVFDYGKEEWRVYPKEKKSTEKPPKAKYPFKESNAEEIRRSNSDLYENLFVGNKKETTMNNNNSSSQSDKGSKSCSPSQKKMASGSSSQKGSGGPKDPNSSKPESQLPPPGEGGAKPKEEPRKEDDNFWESFLKMNILPRDISEIRSPPPPPPPPPPPKSQPTLPPPLEAPKTEKPIPVSKIEEPKPTKIEEPKPTKIEDPKPSVPPTKIEEPRFRVYIPFIGDKGTDKSKVKEPLKEMPKIEDPKKAPAVPPPSTGGVVKQDGATKAPSKEGPKVDDPKKKPTVPPPAAGEIKKQETTTKAPSKEPPKTEEPKKKPPAPPPTAGGVTKQESTTKAPSKEPPKVEDPKKKPPAPPAAGGVTKQESTTKAPSKEPTKVEDPKKKPPAPPAAGGVTKQESTTKAPSKEPPKVEDPKKKPPAPPPTAGGVTKQESTTKAPSKEPTKVEDPKKKTPVPPPSAGGVAKQDSKIKVPSKEAPKVGEPNKKPPGPALGGATKEDPKIKAPPQEAPKIDPKKKAPESPPSAAGDAKLDKVKPSPANAHYEDDPNNNKPPPTIGASNSHLKGDVKAPPSSMPTKIQDPSSPAGAKKNKSAADHYVSENIVEISRNTCKDPPTKYKTKQIETVKLNITSEKRMPSKITEINLNKKCDEDGKETNPVLKKPNAGDPAKKPADVTPKKNEKCSVENKSFYKDFEKYKTPFSDPEYEEKSMKIKSDIESNPNLKKLDNWNKTLVLHDIGKPPENIESWLKDETDKMATLLLKVLQEAADGKPRKKPPPAKFKPADKSLPKGTPFDAMPKKCETTPESFLFRIRTVNLSLENDRKLKPADDRKPKPSPSKDAAGQLDKSQRPYKVIDASKLFSPKEAPHLSIPPTVRTEPVHSEVRKPKLSQTALESVEPSAVTKDLAYQNIVPLEITEDVPGPEFLKKLSNMWKAFPIIGSQLTIFTLLRAYQLVNLKNSFFSSSSPEKARTNAFAKLFMRYGPIVNVQGPLSGNVILIHKPEHFTAVFEQDALMSIRSVFDSLEVSRREAEDKVVSAAISTDWSKPEWNELKRGTNDHLFKNCDKLLDPAEVAGDALINSIRRSRNLQNYVSEDFVEEIKRWSLEGMCSILFEKSFGFLDRKNTNMSWIMEPDKLFMAVEEASSCLNKCEKGFQIWRLLNTGSILGLNQAYRSLSTILSKQLHQAEMNLKCKNESIKEQRPLVSEDLTFLESMLLNDGMTTEEITCNLIDILLIGTNMMTSALGFLLYNLAQNVKVQNKLLKELRMALPTKNSRLDYQSLHSLKYLKACLKESLRLHIPVPVFSRMLQNDILLSNYIIPKGTYIVMDYKATCLKEQIFDDPEKFMPERWLSDEKWMNDLHPFDTFPLCQGPRAELAKKVVEMQLWACVAKVVRNFGIEYHYGEIEETNTLIPLPGKPLKLNFVERDS